MDGDNTPDVVVLDSGGQILFRRGLPGTDNQYAPPLIVNSHTGDALARDVTLYRTADGMAIAATNRSGDKVSVYAFKNGNFERTAVLNADQLPQRIAALGLSGGGRRSCHRAVFSPTPWASG